MVPAKLRPFVLALAWLALGLAAAHALQLTLATLPLAPHALWEALAAGSYAGQVRAAAVAQTAAIAALTLLLGALALAAPRRDGFARSPWARLFAALAPVALSPWVLAQEDPTRRPALLGFTLALSVALVTWLRGGADSEAPAAKGWRAHAPMVALISLHAACFSYLAITRDRALWSATVDLGIFKEALWHTLHGRPMHSPTVGYSFLGEHFSPVLFLLAPLYALSPTSECLLLVQTLAVSASAWPVYRLALELGLRRDLATALAAAMIFSPLMHTALLYDFHMDLLAVPALCALALALHRRRWGAAALSAALAVSVKEDMFIPAAAVLLSRALDGDARDRRRAAALAAAVTAWCLVAMFVLLKRYGPPPGVPVYMSDGEPMRYKFLRNFRHIAVDDTPLRTLLGHPVRFALYALSEARLTTLLGFVAPLALLPFAAGRRAVLLAPLGIVLLSDNPEIVSLRYHYAAVQHPGVFLAAVYGAARLVRGVGGALRSRVALRFVMAAWVVVTLTHPGSLASRVHGADARAVTARSRAVTAMLRAIPERAPVSVSTWLGPRVSNRPWGVFFPYGLDRATWSAVDLQRPPWPQTHEQRDEMLRAMLRGRWGVVSWVDGAVLMRRDGDTSRNAEAMRDLFVRRRYEVEGTEQTDFTSCAVRDAQASDGWARVVRYDDPRPAGYLVFGPFIRLPAGTWRVTFRLRAEARRPDDEVGVVDVFRGGRVLVSRSMLGEDFDGPGWRDVPLEFTVDEAWLDGLEFRVRTTRRATLGADAVSLRALDEPAALSRWTGH